MANKNSKKFVIEFEITLIYVHLMFEQASPMKQPSADNKMSKLMSFI